MDQIWFYQPAELFQSHKLTSFIPQVDDTLENQLNSAVRFSVYLAIVLFCYYLVNKKFKPNVFFIPIFVMIITYLLYSYHPNKEHFQGTFLENKPLSEIKKIHKVPEPDNPFMNTLVTDYGKPQKKTIAPTQITPVKKAIEKNFNKNLYHDIEDVFSRNHSQRQFYTVPSTGVPNDQEQFAKWLYRKEPTCKENKETCNPKW